MAYGCGASLAKGLLCFFNFLLFLAGGAALGVGIWIAVDKHSFISATQIIANEALRKEFQQFTYPTVIEQASYILIAAGSLVFVVSCLGYCGALRESQCLLTCYGVFLIIILVMEITAGALAAAYRKTAEEQARSFLKKSIKDYYGPRNNPDAVTLMWNYFMAELKCCGVDSYRDFQESKWAAANTSLVVPEACCELKGDTADFTPVNENCTRNQLLAWKDGCYEKFVEWLMQHMTVVIAVGIGLGLLQLLGMFLAFCLCRSIDGYIK